MKKFIAGLMVGTMIMSGISYASSSKLEVSMESLKFITYGTPMEEIGFIHEGRAYVPVRFVSENLGKEVLWDAKNRTIHIGHVIGVENGNPQTIYDNGRYRGTYEDGGVQQVSIQFDVENDKLKNLSYRHLAYKNDDYRKMEAGHESYPVWVQHQKILEYLEGKPVEAMYELYSPGNIVEDIDGFTGATIRGSKIFSAIQDGLNRGLYTPAGEFNRSLKRYENGRYRGVFADGGYQQVSIQFDVENNIIKNLSYRHLAYKNDDYRKIEAGHELYPVVLQHKQLLEHLEGKPLETIFDLYNPADFIEDIDGFTGATVRANKVFSAIRDGLNRGIYTPTGDFSRVVKAYPDGRYRGIFADGGVQQVSIQFNLENNIIKNLSYRHLAYKNDDYRKIEEGHELYPVVLQHRQLLEHLEGKPLETIFDLYNPADFIEDIDGFTGATVRANKVFSAIRDGLNRGIY